MPSTFESVEFRQLIRLNRVESAKDVVFRITRIGRIAFARTVLLAGLVKFQCMPNECGNADQLNRRNARPQTLNCHIRTICEVESTVIHTANEAVEKV